MHRASILDFEVGLVTFRIGKPTLVGVPVDIYDCELWNSKFLVQMERTILLCLYCSTKIRVFFLFACFGKLVFLMFLALDISEAARAMLLTLGARKWAMKPGPIRFVHFFPLEKKKHLCLFLASNFSDCIVIVTATIILLQNTGREDKLTVEQKLSISTSTKV